MNSGNKVKICIILGTRPEIIKLYPVIRELEIQKKDYYIIHTNQHYDERMDSIFFNKLQIPKPKYNLNVGSGSHGEMTAKMLRYIEKILINDRPNIVLVQGDTNTVLAGSLAASKLNIKVGHIESGLRSYDRSMPEEINRIVVDHISDYLFVPTKVQKRILQNEGQSLSKIFVTGNTIVDAVLFAKKISQENSVILKELGLEPNKYFLLTIHRPVNTDNESNFLKILSGISEICTSEKKKCIFPVHPRLKDKMSVIKSYKNIISCDPVDFFDSIKLQASSSMIFTDSGGIQEEACILRKKCLVLRSNTERPETLKVGGAMLVTDFSLLGVQKIFSCLSKKNIKWYNPFGDGKSAIKILDEIWKDYV